MRRAKYLQVIAACDRMTALVLRDAPCEAEDIALVLFAVGEHDMAAHFSRRRTSAFRFVNNNPEEAARLLADLKDDLLVALKARDRAGRKRVSRCSNER